MSSICSPPPTASPPVPVGSLTLRLLKTTVFHNASSTNMRGLALLGDLETHAVDYSTSMIRFLQPWAHQGLTPKQWQDLETVIRHYLSKFILLMNKVIKDEGEHRSFVTQFSLGCELHPNGTSR
ncbi:CD1d molecule, partial [Chelydra serpentina]